MEQLMKEIRAYAKAAGVKPSTVLQNAAGYGGKAWDKWEKGGQCTLKTADQIRKYMASNPVSDAPQREAS